MLKIATVRVDDRLIHGCTAAVWLPFLKATKIIAVDNVTAQDEFLCTVMRLSSTTSNSEIFTVDQCINWFKENQDLEENVFIIIKSIDQAYELYSKGLKYEKLTLGTTVPGKDTTKKVQQVNFNEAQEEKIKELVNAGVEVNFQYNPQVKCIPFAEGIAD